MKSKNHSQEDLKEADELSRDVLDNLCNDALDDVERTGKSGRGKLKSHGDNSGNNGAKKQLVSKVNVSDTHQSDLNAILAKAQKVKLGKVDDNFEATPELDRKHVSQSEKDILNEFRNVEQEEGEDGEDNEDLLEEAGDEDHRRGGKRRHRGGKGLGEDPSNHRRNDKEHGRGEENFKTGSFNKEYYSDAFSFSKDNENNEIGRETDTRGEGEEDENPNGLNSFQLMKMKNQGNMSSAQIIKYHDFVAKRAKKVFSSLLKGYSPV